MEALFTLLIVILCCPCFLSKTCEEAIYTDSEKAAIAKLRNEIGKDLYEDYMHRDEYLIHWLRAKNLDVSQAKEMLQRNLKWRKDENIDGLAEEEFPQFEKGYKVDMNTRDKDGRVVAVLAYGSGWDIRKATLAGQLPSLMRYATKVFFEAPSKMSRELGHASGLQFYTHYISTYERYYPQHAKEHILLSVPQIFDTVIELSKPLWSGHLSKHLHFIGLDKKEWYKVLDKFIERSELPVAFGGTNPRQI